MTKLNTVFTGHALDILKTFENRTINNIKAMEILGLKKTTYYKLLKEYKNSF